LKALAEVAFFKSSKLRPSFPRGEVLKDFTRNGNHYTKRTLINRFQRESDHPEARR
jgi:hypothetical protein